MYLGCHDGSCASTDFFVAGNRFDGVTSSGVGYAVETKLNSWGLVGANDIRDAQGPGITVYGSENGDATLVEGNVVVGSRQAATLEIAGGPAIVRNNVVIGGAAGGLTVYDYGGRGLIDDIVVAGNTLWGVGGPAVTLQDWPSGRRLSFVGNAAGRDDAAAALPAEVASTTFAGNVDCGDGAACWVDIGGLDLWPRADGPLVGAGDANDDLPWDYCSVRRPDPPTAGALEPGTPATGSFAVWVDPAERCPAIEGEDTAEGGGDTGGGLGDPDGNDASDADGGCGCAAFSMGRGGAPPRNAPPALLLGGLAALVALRRRAGLRRG